MLAVLVDRLHEIGLLGLHFARETFRQHFAVPDDRGERSTKLVADGREEVRLEAIELLEPVERLLKSRRLVLELTVALRHTREVHLARDEGLVAAEEDEVQGRFKVCGDPRYRLRLGARHPLEQL